MGAVGRAETGIEGMVETDTVGMVETGVVSVVGGVVVGISMSTTTLGSPGVSAIKENGHTK